ncbi:UNVERIFIED_ORG: hypothetical protein BCL66_110135 [Martelella mediterranea]
MNKRSLTERDICKKFILPAVKQAGRDMMLQVLEEDFFTKRRITMSGKLVARGVNPSVTSVSRSAILGLPFPLPPLAEIHRIVTRVGKLMALCDQSENSLTSVEGTRTKLFEALLAKALAGAASDVLQETAE